MLPSSGCLSDRFREHRLDVIKKKVATINIQWLLFTVIKFHVVKEAKEANCSFCKTLRWTLIADDNHTAGYRSSLQFFDS